MKYWNFTISMIHWEDIPGTKYKRQVYIRRCRNKLERRRRGMEVTECYDKKGTEW